METLDRLFPKRALFTVDEVAELLGVSVRAVRDWEYSHRIMAVRLGRRVMIPRDELEKIMTVGISS